MITKITGKLVTVDQETLALAVDHFEYEILIAAFTRRQLAGRLGETVTLHTYQYLEGNPQKGRLVPRMIGFLNVVEREFFDLFCSVDGVGVKKALRAMVRPVPEVAELIQGKDDKGLSALPGVGPASADRIIAKLHRKMPKFALLVTHAGADDAGVSRDVVAEGYEALRALGHSESDARKMIDQALEEKPKFKDVETLIRAIYEMNHR